MKCPRCLRFNEEHAGRCVCSFPFSLEGEQGLQMWFDEVRHILQSAYIAVPTPWQQSGKGVGHAIKQLSPDQVVDWKGR